MEEGVSLCLEMLRSAAKARGPVLGERRTQRCPGKRIGDDGRHGQDSSDQAAE